LTIRARPCRIGVYTPAEFEETGCMFRGSIVPVVTPFKNGELDLDALGHLIEWQIANGSHGISVTGTTGEPSSLTSDERKRVILAAKEAVNGRVPFVPGTGSTNHAETLELTYYAQEIGADAVLLITPYYSRPSQEGLFRHFNAVAKSTELPVILYNIPGRTAVNLEIDTVARLKEANDNIIGVKESNKDFEHINRLLHRMGRDFLVYSGIELLCFPILAIGGAGYVSATGNLMPKEVARLYDLVVEGKWQEAQDLHYQMMPLNDAVFIEINPVPVKTALGLMGKCSPEVRLPLAPLSQTNHDKLCKVLEQYNLI
jgi:4-hydroxy-tetrahydrodipicolinate synthase